MSPLAVDASDVLAARERIAGWIRLTPLLPMARIGVLAKCEGLQETGSFKLRGATNAVLALRPRGVVTASSGNHGQALARAAQRAGVRATVVMTTDSTEHKRRAVIALGAHVVDCAPGTEERNRVAAALAAEQGLALVPPYDHPLVIAGQGTVGLEIAEQAPQADCVVVPLGGGGLISGVATALRSCGFSGRIVGVEPQDGDDTVRSLAAGERLRIPVPRTICDGARSQIPGELTFPIVQALVDEVVAVGDDEVVHAMCLLAEHGVVVEPTGALAVAGALRLRLQGSVVCVISGSNIASADLAALLARG